jgi:hypothetical protein
MARPSATSSRIEPRLMPVNSTPRRSPQASRPCTLSATALDGGLDLGSVSVPGFSSSSERVAGSLLPASSGAAASALGRSADEISTAARSRLSGPSGRHRSRPRWPSRSAAACLRRPGPSARRWRRGARHVGRDQLERGQRRFQLAAHAVVVDHVLGVGRQRGHAAPVAASVALPSRTMKALPPATLTSSSSSACMNGDSAPCRRPPRPR